MIRVQRPAVHVTAHDARHIATLPCCGASRVTGLAHARQVDAYLVAARVVGVVVDLVGRLVAVLTQREAFQLCAADSSPLLAARVQVAGALSVIRRAHRRSPR
ncbi:hypothetical protein INQ40_07775 [Lysobacter sp. H21R4]|nr:hypothetical protein INQ40_07775 [Lysobacter sp. H21R4]